MSVALTLADCLAGDSVRDLLAAGGLARDSAAAKVARYAAAARRLAEGGLAEDAAVTAFYVPGRIEVLGKHTDYAGGRSLIGVPDKGFCLLAATRDDTEIRVSTDDGDGCEFAFSGDLTPTVGHWSNYPMTVARRLARNFPGPLCGAEIAFGSDLPPAAGMSSSSALMIATFFALDAGNGFQQRAELLREVSDRESLAGYLATLENGQSFGSLVGDKGVGTFGGSEDHTAILCCRPGRLSQYSYCPVRFERFVEMPAGHVFAIAASGVIAEKTGEAMEKYNSASRLASRVAELWRQATGRDEPHMAAILAAEPGAREHLAEILAARGDDAAALAKRFAHFDAESETILPAAGDALTRGDVDTFGRQVDLSQHGAEKLLGNQVPETVHLAGSASGLGAAAGSAFGAGFGGSVWALVKAANAETFLDAWRKDYEQSFPDPASRARFFTATAGPAAFELGA